MSSKKAFRDIVLDTAFMILAVVAIGMICGGCKTYYENAGVRVRAGELSAPIEVSEPTSSINVRFLFSLDGVDLYATKGCEVEMHYSSIYAGSWLSSAKTNGVDVIVKPKTYEKENDAE